MNASVPAVHEPEVTAQQQPAALIPADMEQAIRLAQMMAKGKLVPVHLQDSPADCLMVIEQAARWRMSPFAVAQCTSSIKGRLMFEGKLVAAAILTSGILAGRLSYKFEGSGNDRAVIVRGMIRGDTEEKDVRVTFAQARTTNEIWAKQPDQQLVYHGTRVWARRHTPEVMLGVYSPDEDFDEPPPAEPRQAIPLPQSKSRAEQPPPNGEPKPAKTCSEPPAADTPPSAQSITPGALRILQKKLDAVGVSAETLCAEFQVDSLPSLLMDRINEVYAWVGERAKDE